jgi:nucleotide-binding universal stress UspA family protein
MQSIFVASDYLQYATQALYQAYDLAQASCASLTCFHALEKFPAVMREILFPYAALGSDEVEILNEVRSGVEASGRAYLSKVMQGKEEHVRLKVDFSRDSMAKSILHAASECNADLMFCGAYGTKPHTTGIIGSMAATFVAYTRTPLYLIKNPTHIGAHKKILVAFIDPSFSAKLLAWAVSFAMFYPDSDIEIVTPVPNLKRADPYADYQGFAPGTRQIAAATERITHRAKQAVQQLTVPFVFEEHASNLSFKQHAPVMSPAGAILSVAEEISADLIVLPTTQPSLDVDNEIRDVTRNVTEYANQNCLVIPSAFLK